MTKDHQSLLICTTGASLFDRHLPHFSAAIYKFEIREPEFDEEGRGWIAVEVTCDSEKWDVTEATIVQVADLKSADPLKGLHPLAMIRDAGGGTMTLFQIAHFNLQHRADVREGGKAARHFFWAT